LNEAGGRRRVGRSLPTRGLLGLSRAGGGDMTLHIHEDIPGWLVDWSLITLMGNAVPPRDPDDDDDDDQDDDEEEDDLEPPVVREPDE
jgi:hypothetical protein